MAVATVTAYVAANGAKVRGGRPLPTWPGDWLVVGDSLTDGLYDIESSRWGLARTLVPPRVVWNAGISGDSVTGVANRLQAVIDAWPIAQNFLIRIGTNGPYAPSTYQANFQAIFNILAANGKRACFLSIPPSTRGGTTAGVDSTFKAENAWLAAQCAAAPTSLRFIADSDALGDSNYNVLNGVTVDGIHQNSLGVYLQGEAERLPLLELLPLTSPLISDPNDIYPANSGSDQWVQNPLMLGGSSSTFPTGWVWESFGPTVDYTPSVFVDTDGTRWLRMYVRGSNAGYGILRTALMHPAINADMATIKRFDVMLEVRRTNVDVARGGNMNAGVWTAGNQGATPGGAVAPLPASGMLTDRFVVRTSCARNQGNSAGTITPQAIAANSMKLVIPISFTGAAGSGGDIGIFEIRCASVRGSLT